MSNSPDLRLPPEQNRKRLRQIALVIAAIGMLACSDPYYRGINHVFVHDDEFIACTTAANGDRTFYSYFSDISSDGYNWNSYHRTWEEDRKFLSRICRKQYFDERWHLKTTDNITGTMYRYNVFNKTISRSDNGGKTWVKDRKITEMYQVVENRYLYNKRLDTYTYQLNVPSNHPYSLFAHDGELYVSMGLMGVMVRDVNGVYRFVEVGGYGQTYVNVDTPFWEIIGSEYRLAITLMLLVIPTALGVALGISKTSRWWLIGAWVMWVGSLFVVSYFHFYWAFPFGLAIAWISLILTASIFTQRTFAQHRKFLPLGIVASIVLMFFVPYTLWAICIGIIWMTCLFIRRKFDNRRTFISFLMLVSIPVLFISPYILWAQGIIPAHSTASGYAIFLAGAVIITGHRYFSMSLPLEVKYKRKPREA